jgi:serine carboxypeptidase S28
MEMGGIVAGLEHRFFGLSMPEGFDESDTTSDIWSSLTLNNTLLDSVNFIEWIKKIVPDAQNSKVLVLDGEFTVECPF